MGFGVLQEVMIEMQRISVVLQFMVVTNNQNRSNLKPYSSHCSDYLFKQEGGFRLFLRTSASLVWTHGLISTCNFCLGNYTNRSQGEFPINLLPIRRIGDCPSGHKMIRAQFLISIPTSISDAYWSPQRHVSNN